MIEHPEAGRVDPIAGDVHAVRRDGHERCGAGKIKAVLERRGVTASGRRIVDIMKRRGMAGAYARRTSEPHKTRADEAGLANILDREFDGYGPRAHLASDLTYVRVGGKWAYACPLIDLANRGIAGHSADTGRAADLVMAAFATLDFPLTGVEVFRTDRGGGFDNARIDELLDVFDISRSFFADSSIHALRFLSLLLRLLSFDFSLCILLAQAGQYFDIPELGTYSTPHTVQFLGFNAVHRFVGVICNSPTKPMNL